MAYFDDEALNLRAIELYEFTAPATTYRLTSAAQDYLHQGDLFTRTVITRGPIVLSTKLEDAGVAIRMPVASALVQAYGFMIPPQGLDVAIIRVFPDTGNFLQVWSGKVASISASGEEATLLSTSPLTAAMKTVIPTKHFQRACNHTLYDDFCTVDRTDFDYTRTIDSISANGLIITVTASVPEVDDYFKGGEVVHSTSGERRLVISSTSTTITIWTPFTTAAATDEIVAYAGCDHTRATCDSKFSNEPNYGGHPFIPTVNIFKRLRGISDLL